MTRAASAPTAFACALAAMFAAGPASAQAARDFQLPPAATPSPDSRVQGPVDTEAPVPVRPRAIETARPPSPSATGPTIVLPPVTVPPQAQPPTDPARRRTAGATIPPPPSSAAGVPRSAQSGSAASLGSLAGGGGAPTTASPVPPPAANVLASPPLAPATKPAPPTTLWALITGGIAILLAVVWGLIGARRRRGALGPPAITSPVAPAGPADPTEALALSVQAIRLDRSVMNATLGYRVTLRNRSARALSVLAIEADLVSASSERPIDQQVASPGQALMQRHAAERLAAGQSLRFEGQVRLPLAEASAIRQGNIGLLVPLLRMRATAEGALPVATTLVVGRTEGSTARPQPFRLDEPPRSYAPLAQRTLESLPASV